MKLLKYVLSVIIIVLVSCSKKDDNTNSPMVTETFYKGMDLSFQSELEDYNVPYKDANGNAVELLDFVKSKGTNLIRLKLYQYYLDQ